jgi:(1->4)-alpha-D-glucan 1-alpha-D-glucosylmutase
MRTATYRLQLQPGPGFAAAGRLAPYLFELGVSDLYTSPILQAAAGSTHGYDVVDHACLSADLGGEQAFREMVGALRRHGLGLTVDIVPNHMAIDGRANRWWWDVLENGPSSRYASYFDIDWPGDGRSEPTVLVPVLGDRYGRVLADGQVRLGRRGGTFSVQYADHELPVSPRTIDTLLGRAGEAAGSEALKALAAEFGDLPHAARTDPAAVARRHADKERLAGVLAALLEDDEGLAAAVDAEVAAVNSDPDELDRLLVRQNYRLTYWRTAREELDYRRFFNIETLVGLRAEDGSVFADTHQTTARLVADGSVTGLRVDHVDGLADPAGYLERLRRLAPSAYVVVEKILADGEDLPEEWPVDGTTGYDFLHRVANAFVDPSGEAGLSSCYSRTTGETAGWSEVVRRSKLEVLDRELAPELDRLTRALHAVCDRHRQQRDRTRGEVRECIRALLAAFPVYRTYVQPDRPTRPADAAAVAEAVGAAKAGWPEIDPELIDFAGEVLLLEHQGGPEAHFARLFPQLSAPVTAKGVEDTAFYRYHRLASLNEVGGDPGRFGRPLADFHAATAVAAAAHPRSMLTLATHDTKRSPEVRARISLLSELPDYWEDAVTRWLGLTDHHASEAGPEYNIRYLLFQTLVGAWPIATERLVAYMDKAAKEAKVHTSWSEPNAEYDYSLRRFVEATVSDGEFLGELHGFLARQRIVELGRATALAQHTLLLTCPGIPDLYQGTETWDNSLVDPDNRRPVDHKSLARELKEVAAWPADLIAAEYDRGAHDGAKLWLTARLLGHRRSRPDLYGGDTYEPLAVRGTKADHLIAFSRGGLVVLVGRHLWKLGGDWAGTEVELPTGPWTTVVGGGPGGGTVAGGGFRLVGGFLGHGPLAVLARTA